MCESNDADFLDEIIRERSARNPTFPTLADEAYEQRMLLPGIAKVRKVADLPGGRRGHRRDGDQSHRGTTD